jgi:ribosomal-protein-alanine N-acetyltransferase
VRLAPMSVEHAAAWYRWREQPSSQRHNPLFPLTVGDLTRRLSTVCTSDLTDRTRYEYRWIVELGGEAIGTVATERPAWGMGYAEIGYMLSDTHHGRGYGTRAVALLVDKLFRETKLHRIFALISVENMPSRRLVERLGFINEGQMREHYRIQGRRVDEIIYGLLRHEWTPL